MSESPKYLEKVETVSSEAMVYVEHIYCSTRDLQRKYSPSFVENVVARVESTLQPYYAKAQHVSKHVLLMADGTVDTGVQLASDTIARTETTASKVFGEERVKTVKDGMAGTVESLKQHGVLATFAALCCVAKEQATAASGKAVSIGKRTYANSLEPQVKPVVDQGKRMYSALHARIVSDRLYAALHNLTLASFNYLAHLPVVAVPVGTVSGFAYPFVKPMVDPAVANASPYVDALAAHLAPTGGAERAQEAAEADNNNRDAAGGGGEPPAGAAGKEPPAYEKVLE